MKSKIETIIIDGENEISQELIMNNIKAKKIIFLKSKYDATEDQIQTVNISGPAFILKSSGSSRKSRLCLHTIDNLNLSARSSGIWLQEQGFELSNCIICNSLPINHISGLMPLWRSKVWRCDYFNISPKTMKTTKTLLEKTYLKSSFKDKHLITSLVPTQLSRLLRDEKGITWLKLFDLIWVGGALIPPKIKDLCREFKLKISPCYGSSETAAMITSLKPNEFLNGFDNAGEILSDIELRISQQKIIEIKTNRLGLEIIDENLTKNFSDRNGWWVSGDIGTITKINNNKYLKVIGRADNAFNSGGEIVYPNVIKERINKLISEMNLPVCDLELSKIKNELWEFRFNIFLIFNDQISKKKILRSITLLSNCMKSWPRHERPLNLDFKYKSQNTKNLSKNWKSNF